MKIINYKKSLHNKKIHNLLYESTPILPDEFLTDFVNSFLLKKDILLSPLKQKKSPLYLFEPEVLINRSQRFQTAFNSQLDNPAFFYAVKSNNYPEISKLLLNTGFGLDVSSGVELEIAIDLKAENIIFSGPGKTREELELAVNFADRVIVLIDSFHELSTLGEIAGAKKKKIRIGVRLTTNPDGLWRKFGIIPDQLAAFIENVKSFTFLEFKGLQFHTSWNLNAKAQVDFIETLGCILLNLPKEYLKRISFIDIGGGFWPEQGEWLNPAGTKTGNLRKALGLNPGRPKKHFLNSAISIEDFAKQISLSINKHIFPLIPKCRICFEPGRWLCNDVMHLLMTVVDKKNEDLVITDAGTNSIGWERFETDYFPVINLSRPSLSEKSCYVLGSLCTPHDVWGYNYWGDDILPGDVLLIPTQGAYTYSLRQNFIKSLPDVAEV